MIKICQVSLRCALLAFVDTNLYFRQHENIFISLLFFSYKFVFRIFILSKIILILQNVKKFVIQMSIVLSRIILLFSMIRLHRTLNIISQQFLDTSLVYGLNIKEGRCMDHGYDQRMYLENNEVLSTYVCKKDVEVTVYSDSGNKNNLRSCFDVHLNFPTEPISYKTGYFNFTYFHIQNGSTIVHTIYKKYLKSNFSYLLYS